VSDTPEFRARLAKYRADDAVTVYPMAWDANPFVDRSYWDRLRKGLSPRQWAQRVLSQEQPPERATYPGFRRPTHIKPRPLVGAPDITRAVTGGWDYLVGHDPGKLYDVSEILKCYEVGGERYWWVIDELTTERTTIADHVVTLRTRFNERWGAQYLRKTPEGLLKLDTSYPRVLVRVDPHGTTEGTADVAVRKYFVKEGFDAKFAAYRDSMNVATAGKAAVIHRETRIELVNSLLLNAAGETRLYIDVDDRGNVVAPELAKSLQMSERDVYGRAEVERKGENDRSHWPCAVAFALYSYERVRIGKPERHVKVV
jgi:hypothetical protein